MAGASRDCRADFLPDTQTGAARAERRNRDFCLPSSAKSTFGLRHFLPDGKASAKRQPRDASPSLDLHANDLTSVPPEISKLTKLRALTLAHNELTELPPEIGKLTKLERLLLGGNQLTSLPAAIWELTNMTRLGLGWNKITELPPEIGQLTKLDELDLVKCQLATLPPEIGKLVKLRRLELRQNPITDADMEHLTSLAALERLSLGDTKVTQQGIDELQKSLPKCEIKPEL